jgi:hypothetical protein
MMKEYCVSATQEMKLNTYCKLQRMEPTLTAAVLPLEHIHPVDLREMPEVHGPPGILPVLGRRAGPARPRPVRVAVHRPARTSPGPRPGLQGRTVKCEVTWRGNEGRM